VFLFAGVLLVWHVKFGVVGAAIRRENLEFSMEISCVSLFARAGARAFQLWSGNTFCHRQIYGGFCLLLFYSFSVLFFIVLFFLFFSFLVFSFFSFLIVFQSFPLLYEFGTQLSRLQMEGEIGCQGLKPAKLFCCFVLCFDLFFDCLIVLIIVFVFLF
jgi:hypothetical protein